MTRATSRRIIGAVIVLALALGAYGNIAAEPAAWDADQIVTITAFDGVQFDGRLRLPDAQQVDRLVIFVNGSGPNTYDNQRTTGEKEFLYHDLFADELNRRGAAYFSYNTRGVTPGDEPPLYAQIDEATYKTYKPSNEIRDMASVIEQLKQREPLKHAQVVLLGWSAGAIVAPQAALQYPGMVDMLVLAGYPNDTMEGILEWQQTGGASMVFYREYFDTDKDGAISREEYEADPYKLREALGNATFADLDRNGDGALTAEDFAILLAQSRKDVFAAFENGDDEWLKQNYAVRLTSQWYLDYQNIEANQTALPKLDIPIHIFQGEFDQNTPVEGARRIEAAFRDAGKTNLTVRIYPADHDLNYLQYVMQGTIPQPIQELLDTCAGRITS